MFSFGIFEFKEFGSCNGKSLVVLCLFFIFFREILEGMWVV